MKVIKKSGFAKKAAAFTLSAAMIASAFSGLSAVNSEQLLLITVLDHLLRKALFFTAGTGLIAISKSI